MENGAKWQIYRTYPETWEAMYEACKDAKRTIDLEKFIVSFDEIGRKFFDLFEKKAAEGVKIRILADAAGSIGLYRMAVMRRLKAKGIKITFFNTFIPGTSKNHTALLFRDHQKLLIVDQKVAFTGGINLEHKLKEWMDTHMKIEGKIVKEMQASFNTMWAKAYKKKSRIPRYLQNDSKEWNYILNIPIPRRHFLYYRLIDAINNANNYIYLTTAYFAPSLKLVRALERAVRRDVDVRLLIPYKPDSKLVALAGRSFFERLLRRGVKIVRYKGPFIHSKTAVIDDNWATVGSLNLDNMSFFYNFEGNIVSRNQKFAEDIREQFEVDLKESSELTLESWLNRSLFEKFLELIIRPVRRFL